MNILSYHSVFVLPTMAPILNLFDYIFSNYFNEFLKYDHIQELQLPLWLYALVGIFVLAIISWTVLVVRGLNNLVHRALSNSNGFKGKNGESAVHCAGGSGDRLIWAHIKPRPPTRRQ